MSKSKNTKKKGKDEEETRLINPATDTLKIDLELAKTVDPVLIVIRGGMQGKKFSLKGEQFFIGRDKSVQIQVDDQNASRQHARIFHENDTFFIQDLGSRNGTYVNDQPISTSKRMLEKEDMIKIGGTILKFLPAGQLETLYHINLSNAAYVDKLTGLYNRKYISEVLDVEFKRAKALHSPFSVIIFDIDNFKKINDTHGHAAGDQVLTGIGQQVKASGLRERDLAGRFGGEEFLVILPGSSSEQAFEVAERIRKKIESHNFVFDEISIPVTVSLGLCSLKKEHLESTDIYKEADKALYASKNNGKNRITIAE